MLLFYNLHLIGLFHCNCYIDLMSEQETLLYLEVMMMMMTKCNYLLFKSLFLMNFVVNLG
jgi:hypothetical protein